MKIDYLHDWIHNILCSILLVACCAVEVFKNLFECSEGSLLVFVMARLEERTQNLIREFLPQMPCLA